MGETETPTHKHIEGWPAHSWELIETLYRERGEWLMPMAELARRVRLSGIGRSLHALTSMNSLICMMHPTIYFDEPRLVIWPNGGYAYSFEFKHPVGPAGRRIKDWTAVYPAHQLLPAFSRFLGRVGWVPEGHPAHAILLSEE